jgi:hypothetical protein
MLTLFLIVIIVMFFQGGLGKSGEGAITYNLNGRQYRLLVADEEKERNEGLMYRRQLDGVEGMIFVFPEKSYRSFWNKNTYLNLDVYWIDDDKIIGKDYLPSLGKSGVVVSVTSPKPVNKVVELQVK